ncbi:MAG: hypothetical protein M3547_05790 [Acidobacteriota bacterium]|nr:hypothetical protein [Acidobacteriota bacterium]
MRSGLRGRHGDRCGRGAQRGLVGELEPAEVALDLLAAQLVRPLQRIARDLRDVGKSMQAHARATVAEDLNKAQEARLAEQRRGLETTADAAIKLAIQIENRESGAQGRALTRADMNSLGAAADVLTEQINRRLPEASTSKKQMVSTAFQSFDKKSNQIYGMLASVVKTLREMRSTGAKSRNGL